LGIKVQNLVKRFGDRTIIDHVSFEIAHGELVSLLGPSGCGKTTTLRCIAGLETPEEGRIEIDDEIVFDSARGIMVEPYHRSIGMVFQSYAIWPHLSVFQNVAFPLQVRRRPRAEVESRVMRALDMVGLASFRDRSSQQLSGGQQQRVAVARAIVHSPAALLFDEPLSNLDAKLRDRTRAEIRRLQRELHVATVYVTHDQGEALSLSDRMLVMGEGRIHQAGTPQQIYGDPQNAFVADVVGAANFFDVEIQSAVLGDFRCVAPDGTLIDAVGRVAVPGPGRVMVRPDRLVIELDSDDVTTPDSAAAAAPNRLRGTVVQRLFLGGHFEYAVAVGSTLLRVFSPVQIEEDAGVVVSFVPRDGIVLGADAVSAAEDSESWVR
jgi:ABC-type Fe3+/spermidine/putrescine transport system ATPase subunit